MEIQTSFQRLFIAFFKMILSETYEYDRISFVKSIFDGTGLSYTWTKHFVKILLGYQTVFNLSLKRNIKENDMVFYNSLKTI